jgi:alpha-D-xyloside xylohydrolase
MVKEGVQNQINLVRCAWAGSQLFGALVWSGDVESTFESLQSQVRAGLNMAIAGIPWWTTDIGGFHGGDIKDPDFRHLIARWFEYGCFCPVFRLHGFRFPHREQDVNIVTGTGYFGTGADNEVWTFGEENYQIFKKYLFIRERLRSYIAEQMKQAHEKGTPVMRPLFYDFYDDIKSWDIDDQYMFGPDIMVAPVINAQQFERNVYLPAGANWKEVWTGKCFEGGKDITVHCPIDQIPLFVKNGIKLPIVEYWIIKFKH